MKKYLFIKQNRNFLLFIIFILSLSSCKIMYIPNMENVPLFKEKGEVRATISTTNFQAAVAVANNVGVMVNGYANNGSGEVFSSQNDFQYISNRYFIEGAVGGFFPVEENFIFEVYAGGGVGYISYNENELYSIFGGSNNGPFSKYSADIQKLFLQPNMGFTNENIDFALSFRFVGLKFSNIDTVNYTVKELIDENIYDLDRPIYFFIEPAITIRFGYKWAKFHVQTIYSKNMSIEPINYRQLNVNFGIHINIAERYKK